MTEDPLPPAMLEALRPEAVVPAMLVLASEGRADAHHPAPGGAASRAAHITLTPGCWIASAPTRRRCWRRS